MLHFSISQKLMMLVGIAIMAFVVSQGYTQWVERANTGRLQDIDQRLYPTLELTTLNLGALLLMEQQINSAVATGDDQALAQTQTQFQEIRANLAKLSSLSAELAEGGKNIDRQLDAWYTTAIEIAQSFLRGDVDFTKVAAQASKNAERLEALRSSLQQMKQQTETSFTESIRTTIENSQRANLLALVIAAIAVICLVTGSVFLVRSIKTSLHQVSESLRVMASGQGDLTTRIKYEGKDEVSGLVDNFNRFIDKLHHSFGEVSRDVNSLSEVATRLTRASSDNLKQINSQAEGITSTRRSIDELVSSVELVAEYAVDASEQAKAASTAAAEGKLSLAQNADTIRILAEEVKSAADIVDRFEGFSRDVGNLLNTIQTVAEQTNLLALNAAIEAARAGDHGRGFAVVADEVRGLAVRTRQATEEIHSVIEELRKVSSNAVGAMQNSVNRASSGVTATLASGETLNTILTNIQEISAINGRIAASTHQQTATFAEVSQHVSGIDSNTAQVISSTKELDGVSHDIDRISRGLRQISSQFRV